MNRIFRNIIIIRGIKTTNSSYMNMSKLKKGKQSITASGSDGKKQVESKIPEKSSISISKEGAILIALQVKPGAKFNSINDISEDAVSISISAPPVDGEANHAIIKYFSQLLQVSKSDIDLKGGKSRQKILSIKSERLTSTSQAMDILVKECGK